MRLQTKFALVFTAILFGIGIPALISIYLTTENMAENEIARESVIFARELATKTEQQMSLNNINEVQREIAELQMREPSVAFVAINSPQGAIPSPITGFQTYDSAVYTTQPISEGRLGNVHIGMTETETASAIRASFQIILTVLILSAVLGTGLFFYTARKMISPLQEIHSAAHKLSTGDFKARAEVKTGDELEELAEVFNKTTEALGKLDEDRKQIDQLKTRFLSITSHELRSPMTPMKAQLQMLQEGYYGKLMQEQRSSVDMILRNADRLDQIIADFLEISRIEAARLKFTFAKTDIKKVAFEVIEYMKGFMPEKKINFVADISKLPIFEADENRIAQVLRNLLSNAVKFSDKDSKIIVKAVQKEKFIQFSVQDFGAGIPEKDQLRLFEPFFQVEQTLNRNVGGTGLGLAICRGIVMSQNGRIWLNSEIGKGTTFHFTVPTTPVKDIKPIKILFSSKEVIEQKLSKIFSELLGPIGKSEFEDVLKEKFSKEQLHSYVDDLTKRKVIYDDLAKEFKHKIDHAFMMVDMHDSHSK